MLDRRHHRSPRRRLAHGTVALACAVFLSAAAPFGVPCCLFEWCDSDTPTAPVAEAPVVAETPMSCCEIEAREAARDGEREVTAPLSDHCECVLMAHPQGVMVLAIAVDESASVSRLVTSGAPYSNDEVVASASRFADKWPPGALAGPMCPALSGISLPLLS